MPLLQTLATVQEEQSLGRLQELTSPVLSKVKEALIYTRLVNAQQRAFGSGTVVMDVPTMEGMFQSSTTPQCSCKDFYIEVHGVLQEYSAGSCI